MSEGPKLYSNKPKKAHLKQLQREQGSPSPQSSSSSSMGTQPSPKSPAPPPPPPPPPPQPPGEPFARRYKFLWPLLLTVNFGIGAYLFTRTKRKDTGKEEVPDVPPTPGPTTAAVVAVPVSEKTLSPSPIIEPMMSREPIPQNEQRELFKWLLEEKRKVKPKDSEEKKRIDEEKAILKQFIRAKSIPSL